MFPEAVSLRTVFPARETGPRKLIPALEPKLPLRLRVEGAVEAQLLAVAVPEGTASERVFPMLTASA